MKSDIRSLTLSINEEEHKLVDQFFSEPPQLVPVDDFLDLGSGDGQKRLASLSPGSRFAMYTTFVILGVALIGISSYTVYAKVIMPTPVEIGVASIAPEIPDPVFHLSDQASASKPNDHNAKAVSVKRIERKSLPSKPSSEAETPSVLSPQEQPDKKDVDLVASNTEPQPEELSIASEQSPEQGPAQQPPPEPKTVDDAVSQLPPRSASVPIQPSSTPIKDSKATQSTSPAMSSVKTVAKSTRVKKAKKVKRSRTKSQNKFELVSTEVSKNPTTYTDIVKRANSLYTRRSTRKKAVQEYERALILNPAGGEALRRLAYYYLNQGLNLQAKQLASRAVKVNGNNAQSWLLLGAARDALNDRKGAVQAYRKCAECRGAYALQCKRLF